MSFTLALEGHASLTSTLALAPPRFRFVWDDENPDYGYKCRTQAPGFEGPNNPPAVLRYYRTMHEGDDYRCNLTKDPTWRWEETTVLLNGGGLEGQRDFDYWVNPNTAQFNTTGWAQFAYLGMCGNEIDVIDWIGSWVRFRTLLPADWLRARSMTLGKYIHQFTCVTWDNVNKTTKRIESTGTLRGKVYYGMVTNEGFAYIPARHVVRM